MQAAGRTPLLMPPEKYSRKTADNYLITVVAAEE
jgi:hypothetical protein